MKKVVIVDSRRLALKRGPDVDIEGILDQPAEPSSWDEEDEAERRRWAEQD